MSRLRVGVTGHRHYDDAPIVEGMTAQVLGRVLAGSDGVIVVSSLAEGADRLVARLCLARPASALHAVLPVEPHDYERDFESDASRRDFAELLARAESVVVVDAVASGSRDDAYRRAGHHVVDSVDVVIALWDGAPSRGRGGTAEIVQYALDRDVLVEVVLVTRHAPA